MQKYVDVQNWLTLWNAQKIVKGQNGQTSTPSFVIQSAGSKYTLLYRYYLHCNVFGYCPQTLCKDDMYRYCYSFQEFRGIIV